MTVLNKNYFSVSPRISNALKNNQPVVALESTVITHGLPYPHNFETAISLESIITNEGAIPATIGIIDGIIRIGLGDNQLKRLSQDKGMKKVSIRDIADCIVRKECGGTTVAGTMHIVDRSGIRVFATGGIGGVHRMLPSENCRSMDISTDLIALSRYPVIVVCAGAKAILDIPATIEVLETYGVPVLGYQTDEFPAFYSRKSGIKLSTQMNGVDELAEFVKIHWELGFSSGVLVVVPPPEDIAIPMEILDEAIVSVVKEADEQSIRGKLITPFLLDRINTITGGLSMKNNIALLQNNAQVAAQIAICLSKPNFTQIA